MVNSKPEPQTDLLQNDPMAKVKIGWFAKSTAATLIRTRWVLLVVALLIVPIAWHYSNQLDFNRSIESMFAEDDPVLEPYRRLRSTFGGNEIVLAVYEDKNLLADDGSGIRRLYKISRDLKEAEGVQATLSLAELNDSMNRLYFFKSIRLTNLRELFSDPKVERDVTKINVPIVNSSDDLAKQFLEMFQGYTHSADGTTVAIACILEPKEEAKISRQELVANLRNRIQQENEGQLTGEPVMLTDGFRYIERDGRRLGLNCVVLMSLVIIILFRSVRWVLIPLAVMYLTLLLTRAVLVLAGFQLSMVSSMLTAIVTVIAVATTMHVILRYREARQVGHSQAEAMKSAIGLLFWPIVWACCTDAAGFAALMIASVGPVQDFGFMMALASMLVLLCIFLLVAPLGLLGKFDADPGKAWGEGRMRTALQRSGNLLGRWPKKLAVVIGLLALIASIGNLFLKVETDFTKNFRADTPIAVSYRYVEQRLGGAGLIDVVLPLDERLDAEYLDRVDAFQKELRAIRFPADFDESVANQIALTKVLSIVDVKNISDQVPLGSFITVSMRLKAMEQLMPSMFDSLVTREADENGQRFYRVMLRTSQQQTAKQKEWLTDQIQSKAEQHFPAKPPRRGPETTGFYVLISRLVHSILRDQYWTFGLAVFGIGLVMAIAFRSLKLALIAMIPNLLPVLVVMGSLGWLGIEINMGAAMIAAVSLGLSIDSSIHYLWSFQRWRDAGLTVTESVGQAQLRVGRAVVFSTLALVLGFSSLCISEFVPTIYFGALVGATMLGGLFGNLVILPIMLYLFFPDDKKEIGVVSSSETSG